MFCFQLANVAKALHKFPNNISFLYKKKVPYCMESKKKIFWFESDDETEVNANTKKAESMQKASTTCM